MFKKIVEFFTGKKPESKYAHPLDAVTTPNVPQAPYKVEPPATTPIPYVPANEPPRCGCGRSPTGYCVGLHKLSPEQWATSTDNPDYVTKVVVPEPVKKKRTAAKKPAVAAAPVEKKPAKPRTKKTTQ